MADLHQLARELHHGVVRKFPRRRVYSPGVNLTWSCDLLDYLSLKEHNNGYSYILICVDVFSKYVRAVPLLNKTAASVLKAFKSFDVLPKKLWTDKGSEFYNKSFQSFCQNNNIILYSTYSESKSVIAERFNRTIRGWLQLYFTAESTFRWVDVLHKLIDKYNLRIHSTTKMSPNDAIKPENFNQLYLNQYPPLMKLTAASPILMSPGELVRISRDKGVFEKGQDYNWSEEVFKIAQVNNTNPITYKLVDLLGESIEGSFYRQELLKTKLDPNDISRIEKVIKTDAKNKKAMVKWRGYSSKFNSWVPLSRVIELQPKGTEVQTGGGNTLGHLNVLNPERPPVIEVEIDNINPGLYGEARARHRIGESNQAGHRVFIYNAHQFPTQEALDLPFRLILRTRNIMWQAPREERWYIEDPGEFTTLCRLFRNARGLPGVQRVIKRQVPRPPPRPSMLGKILRR